MRKHWIALGLVLIGVSSLGMARKGQYDEEARAAERAEKKLAPVTHETPSPRQAAKNFVGGLKQATVDSTKSLLSETASTGREQGAVVGTLEGARTGSGTALDQAVKGTVKVATLGYGEVNEYEVEEPQSGSDDTTKIKFKIPGT